jgi:hypothetical protein
MRQDVLSSKALQRDVKSWITFKVGDISVRFERSVGESLISTELVGDNMCSSSSTLVLQDASEFSSPLVLVLAVEDEIVLREPSLPNRERLSNISPKKSQEGTKVINTP